MKKTLTTLLTLTSFAATSQAAIYLASRIHVWDDYYNDSRKEYVNVDITDSSVLTYSGFVSGGTSARPYSAAGLHSDNISDGDAFGSSATSPVRFGGNLASGSGGGWGDTSVIFNFGGQNHTSGWTNDPNGGFANGNSFSAAFNVTDTNLHGGTPSTYAGTYTLYLTLRMNTMIEGEPNLSNMKLSLSVGGNVVDTSSLGELGYYHNDLVALVAFQVELTEQDIAEGRTDIEMSLTNEAGNRVKLGSSGFYLTFDAAVPEPSTATLSLLGLGALVLRRRRA